MQGWAVYRHARVNGWLTVMEEKEVRWDREKVRPIDGSKRISNSGLLGPLHLGLLRLPACMHGKAQTLCGTRRGSDSTLPHISNAPGGFTCPGQKMVWGVEDDQ